MKRRLFILNLFLLLIYQFAAAQWTSVNSPALPVAVKELATAGDVVFALAGFPVKVYRSLDNGTTWQLAVNGLPENDYWNTLEGTPSGEAYIGSSNRRVFRTTNGGENWELISTISSPQYPSIEDLKVHNGTIFLTIGETLLKSDNQGQTWSTVKYFLGETRKIIIRGDEIFVDVGFGDDLGLHYSPDGGGTWQKISFNGMNLIVCAGFHVNRLFAQGSGSGKLYFTDNLGGNWTEITSWHKETFLNSFYSDNINLYAAGEGGIYRTQDNGINWQYIGGGFPHNTDSPGLALAPNGDLLGASKRGIYKSTDNTVSWSLSSDGIPVERIQVYDMAVYAQKIFIAGANSFFASEDSGDNWLEYSTGLPAYPASEFLLQSNGNLYAGGNATLVKWQSDNTWLNLSDSLPVTWPIYTATNGTDILLANTNKIYRSSDGTSWLQVSSPSNSFYLSQITFHDGYIFVGNTIKNLHRTDIENINWESVGNDSLDDYGLGGLLSAGDTLFAYGYKSAYYSVNNGDDWLIFFIPGKDSSAVQLIHWLDAGLLAVLDNRLLASRDGGANWSDKSEGFPQNQVVNTFIQNDGYIYLGSSNGIYRTKSSDLLSGFHETIFTGKPLLYPNPTVTGQFFLNPGELDLSNAKLSVTDVLGRVIMFETLGNQAGKYYFELPAYAPGIYQVTLMKGDYRWFGKLLVN